MPPLPAAQKLTRASPFAPPPVTISYTVGVPFPARSKTLATKFSFVCDCVLCEQEQLSSRVQHEARVEDLYRLVAPSPMPELSVDFLLGAYERTSEQVMGVHSSAYAAQHHQQLRPQLWPPCHVVAVRPSACFASPAPTTDLLRRPLRARQDVCFQLFQKTSLQDEREFWSEKASMWAGLAVASCGWGRRLGSVTSAPGPDDAQLAVPFEWQEGAVASLLLMAGVLKLAVPTSKGDNMASRLAQKAVEVDRICVSGPGPGGQALFLHRYGALLTAYGLTPGAPASLSLSLGRAPLLVAR